MLLNMSLFRASEGVWGTGRAGQRLYEGHSWIREIKDQVRRI